VLIESNEFSPKEMDWGVTESISYREVAFRWIQTKEGAPPVKVVGVKAPSMKPEMPPGVCPQGLRALLEREEKKAWWCR